MATAPFLFPSDRPTDEELLVSALGGNPSAWTQLVRRFNPYIVAIVSRRAPSLAVDLRQDVANEVWIAIDLRGEGGFDPKTSARDYVSSRVKDAVDKVRADYRAPAERSRARDGRRRQQVGTDQWKIISIAELTEEEQPSAADTWGSIDRGIDLDRAQALAAPDVALAIDLIRSWGLTFDQAAGMVGLKRTTLLRRLAQLGRLLGAA